MLNLSHCHWSSRFLDLRTVGSLSNVVFERHTSTGSGRFALFGRDFEQILGQVVSLRVTTLGNTNLKASRRIKREKGSHPVDVRRSKTSPLKLPNVVLLSLLNLRGAHNSEWATCTRVTAFLQTCLFSERFWREFGISVNSHKPVSKTYKPNNGIFDILMTFIFPFDNILYFECALRGLFLPLSQEKLH